MAVPQKERKREEKERKCTVKGEKKGGKREKKSRKKTILRDRKGKKSHVIIVS